MSGGGHRDANLQGTDLGGVRVHSAGLVKTSSGDASSSSSGGERGRPPWRRLRRWVALWCAPCRHLGRTVVTRWTAGGDGDLLVVLGNAGLVKTVPDNIDFIIRSGGSISGG
uniref:Uncharacterized protein n=1 Tax=Triticum urartu TaxID=4572 RepID=A0A8R7QHG5_TRIUA